MKRWYKYVRPYLPFFILGPIGMIVEVIGEVVMPKLLAVVINGANNGTLTVPTALGAMGLMILTALLMMAGGVCGAYFGSRRRSTLPPTCARTSMRACRNSPVPISISSPPARWSPA